jgi:hypothetical protein
MSTPIDPFFASIAATRNETKRKRECSMPRSRKINLEKVLASLD